MAPRRTKMASSTNNNPILPSTPLLPPISSTSSSNAPQPAEDTSSNNTNRAASPSRRVRSSFVQDAVHYINDIFVHEPVDDPVVPDGDRQREREHMKRIIYAVLAVLLFIFGILSYDLIKSGSLPLDLHDICLSPACIRVSSNVISNLSPRYTELEPCNDFHEYVCGGYEGLANSSTFQDLTDHSDMVLQRILDSRAELQSRGHDEQDIYGKMRDFYTSCIDTDTIQKRGLLPVKKIVEKVSLLFPRTASMEYANSLVHNTAEVFSYLAEMDLSALASIRVVIDRRRPDRQIIEFGEPTFGLAIKDYFNANADKSSSPLQEYEDSIARAFDSFGYGKQPADNTSFSRWRTGSKSQLSISTNDHSRKMAKLVVKFEQSLAEGVGVRASKEYPSPTASYRGLTPEVQWSPLHLDEFDKLIPHLGAKKIIAHFTSENSQLPRTINVRSLQYFENLAKVLSGSSDGLVQSKTSRVSMQAYFAWRCISNLQRLVIKAAVAPSDTRDTRQEECTKSVISLLGPILGHFYVQQEVPPKTIDASERLIDMVRSAFLASVQVLATKDVTIRAGYPQQLANATYLSQVYRSLVTNPQKFFENTIDTTRHLVRQRFGSLDDLTSEWSPLSDFLTTPVPVYDNDAATLTVPATLLQPPIFDESVPDYMNFGGLGGTIGSVLSRLANRPDDQIPTLRRKSQKLASRFQSNCVAFGLQSAFEAWKLNKQEIKETMLPGLERFSAEQSLFLSFGQLWCGNKDGRGPEGYSTDLRGRLNAAVNASQAFQQSWNCATHQREV